MLMFILIGSEILEGIFFAEVIIFSAVCDGIITTVKPGIFYKNKKRHQALLSYTSTVLRSVKTLRIYIFIFVS